MLITNLRKEVSSFMISEVEMSRIALRERRVVVSKQTSNVGPFNPWCDLHTTFGLLTCASPIKTNLIRDSLLQYSTPIPCYEQDLQTRLQAAPQMSVVLTHDLCFDPCLGRSRQRRLEIGMHMYLDRKNISRRIPSSSCGKDNDRC